MTHSPSAAENRVLVLSPQPRDLFMTQQILTRAGFHCQGFVSARALLEAFMADGGGMVLIAVEALFDKAEVRRISQVLHDQPAWSDLPVSILTNAKISTPAELESVRAFEHLHSVTFLDRPVRIAALVSTVRSALQGRLRQYQVRDLLRSGEADVRQRDEFLAMLSHELRNPLAAINNAVQVMKLAPQRGDEVSAILERQVGQLTRMVDDLLDVARVTRGKIELVMRQVDLREVLEGALDAVRPLMEEKRQSLTLDMPSAPLLVRADPIRLTQAFSNLLHNAAKYTGEQGAVRLCLEEREGRAELRITDNGVGLDEENRERLFDLFVQGRRGIDRQQGGLGIGLTLVRQLVQLHDGEVSAHSDGPGTGCEFQVRLPLADEVEQCRERGFDAQNGSCKVLIVDDNQSVAQATAMLIEALGHEVRTVYSGREALAYARDYQPEVIFLDLGMPEMDGFEVARALQSLPDRRAMLLVALTGYGGTEVVARAHECGFDRHLLKPVDLASLQEVLALAWRPGDEPEDPSAPFEFKRKSL